jgi:hypothetical protein
MAKLQKLEQKNNQFHVNNQKYIEYLVKKQL